MPSQIQVRVTPRSSRNRIELDGDQIKAWLTATPTDNQANESLVRLLADTLNIAPSKVTILRGQKSRTKTVTVEDLEPSEILLRLQSH